MFAGTLRLTAMASLALVTFALFGCAQTVPLGTGPIQPVPGAAPPPTMLPPPPPTAPIVKPSVAAMNERKMALDKAAMGTGIEVTRVNDQQIKVVIPSDIAFAPFSVTAGPAVRPFLDTLAASLGSNVEIQVAISAHTDNVGSDPQNNTLSLERARSVRDYLLGKGVLTPFIQAVGRGARDPVAGNETAAGRTRNRRMEIVLRDTAK